MKEMLLDIDVDGKWHVKQFEGEQGRLFRYDEFQRFTYNSELAMAYALEEARERAHYAEGTADLALKKDFTSAFALWRYLSEWELVELNTDSEAIWKRLNEDRKRWTLPVEYKVTLQIVFHGEHK